MTTDTVSRTKPGGMDAPPQGPRANVRLRLALATLCTVVGVACVLDAGWIYAKAAVAQRLLEHAWQRGNGEGGARKPWPWADTWPVARLRAPDLEQDQIVLAGDSGRTLAFGPGWAEASAPPNDIGVTVISGHRDTHFSWLRKVSAGDSIQLETHQGALDYVVVGTRVVDSRHERIDVHDADRGTLLLVTCWPFDAVVPGGPLRYVVTAQRVDATAIAGTGTDA